MSRGLLLGVLIGAGGATAFWRLRMQELAQKALPGHGPVTAPAQQQVQPAERPTAHKTEQAIQSATTNENAASVRTDPVEHTREQPSERAACSSSTTSAATPVHEPEKHAEPTRSQGTEAAPNTSSPPASARAPCSPLDDRAPAGSEHDTTLASSAYTLNTPAVSSTPTRNSRPLSPTSSEASSRESSINSDDFEDALEHDLD